MSLKKLISLTVIHRCVEPGKAADLVKKTPAIAPKVDIIPSKTVFMPADQAQMDDLIAIGAAAIAPKSLLDEEGDDGDDTTKKPAKVAKEPAKVKEPAKKADKLTPQEILDQQSAEKAAADEKANAEAAANAGGKPSDGNDLV